MEVKRLHGSHLVGELSFCFKELRVGFAAQP